MRVVVSDSAARLIDEQGGRIYVWPRRGRCCGSVTTLMTATEPPPGKEFRRVESDGQIELFLPSALPRLPDQLLVELRRFPRRVEAYWNGCAWVL